MMVEAVRKIRIFLASPGDVQAERDSLSKVIEELNSTIGAARHFVLELVRWETHCYPAMGRPQSVINEQIGPYDIFVGIMWKRFGSPTGVAESGTEEEFRIAYSAWKEGHISNILFYFCQADSPMPKSQKEVEQLSKVLAFREELSRESLVWEYTRKEEFADEVRPHLTRILLMDELYDRMKNSRQINFEIIDKIVRRITEIEADSREEEEIELPAGIKEKMVENKLSDKFEEILRIQMTRFSQIDKYLKSGVLKKRDIDNLSISVKTAYLRFKNKYDNGDDIFIAMLDYLTLPQSSEEERNAYCAVLCYFFHSCGVFENVDPK